MIELRIVVDNKQATEYHDKAGKYGLVEYFKVRDVELDPDGKLYDDADNEVGTWEVVRS